MKRFIAIVLSISMILAVASCSGNTNNSVVTTATAVTTNEDDTIDDKAWDGLKAIGQVKTENGLFIATLTLPREIVGDEITQADIDASAGKSYISGKLNEDGSVTYKMTKKQHKEMMDTIVNSFEQSFNEMLQNDALSFTSIKHNEDFTQFDVTVSGDSLGLVDTLATAEFYTAGGMYGIFSGKKAERVVVNYYSSTGKLIDTADSSRIGESDDTKLDVSESEFDVKKYLIVDYSSTICYFVVRNNSKATVAIDLDVTALDKAGNTIGADTASIDVIGPGEESICYAVFSDVKGVNKVDYTMKIDNTSYEPVISGFEVVKHVNKKNVVVTVTNNSNRTAEFVEVFALFFDKNGKVIGREFGYLGNNIEFKPGEKASIQLNCGKAFKRVEVYITGRS